MQTKQKTKVTAVQKEIETLKRGQLLWITRDYLTNGIYQVKFFNTGSNYSSVEVENKDYSRFLVSKPDWHITAEAALLRITQITANEQIKLIEKQYQASQLLLEG
jgi:hypothetical protein